MRHALPIVLGISALITALAVTTDPTRTEPLPRAFVDGAGWQQLTLADFENVNGTETTWTEREGIIVCSGRPLGGARTKKRYTNFEMVLEWKHNTHAGNSGVFLWCPESAFTDLPAGQLPRSGIEVQVHRVILVVRGN